MNYPLISEYVEAIRYAEDNFDKLANLRPVLDNNGNPIMSSGNFAVVFKMRDVSTGRLFAVKCFIKEQEGRGERYAKITEELQFVSSPYILHVQYIDRELFVNTTNCDEEEFPVLVMDWVDGQPLDAYLRENLDDEYALQMLAYRFCNMGAWLLSQPFAHGDLKPDNILVRDDGSLALVDYDGMYVPSMKGEKAYEIGSPDFRHPQRTADDFDEHIDDFSIASIALSLKAISIDSSLYGIYSEPDRLLFSEKDYMDFGESSVFNKISSMFSEYEFKILLSLFNNAIINGNLNTISYSLFLFTKPEKPIEDNLTSEITNEEKSEAVEDEYGAFYTKDGTKLISGPKDVWVSIYKIREGTKVIGNSAFLCRLCLQKVIIPNSVKSIGDSAFWRCESLNDIIIPDSVMQIGDRVFNGCKKLSSLKLVGNEFHVYDDMLISNRGRLISCWSKKEHLIVPSNVTHIGKMLFKGFDNLHTIYFGDGIIDIEEGAFMDCTNLEAIRIPYRVKGINKSTFWGCQSLRIVQLPNDIKFIGECAFYGCNALITFIIPESIINIGDGAFSGRNTIINIKSRNKDFYILNNMLISSKGHLISCWTTETDIIIPDKVTSIGDYALQKCESIKNVIVPLNLSKIGKYSFKDCSSLQTIIFSDGLTNIGIGAFEYCGSLQSIILPKGIDCIAEGLFYFCSSLQFVYIPNGVERIENKAFAACDSLKFVVVPETVLSIGEHVFESSFISHCICIPKGTKEKFINLFRNENTSEIIEIPN